MSTFSAVASGYGDNPQGAVEIMDYALRAELSKISAMPGSKVVSINHSVIYIPQNVGYHGMGPFFASAVIAYEVETQSTPAPFPDAPPAKKYDIPPFPFTTPESVASIRNSISGRSANPGQQ